MVLVSQQIRHQSGIPLGGIGAGSVEVRPDGLFHEWLMFNTGIWSPGSPCCVKDEAMSPYDLLFLVRTRTSDGQVLVRFLALDEKLHDLYSMSWARSVESIGFEGTFPVARLTYEDPDLPVHVQAEVFSPFVPLDSRTSGTPGFHVYFAIRNITSSPVDVSILGVMRNPVGHGQPSARAHNRLTQVGEGKAIHMSADDLMPRECTSGDMTLSAVGGRVTHITGSYHDEQRPVFFWQGDLAFKPFTYMHQFKEDGRLPNLNAETAPEFPEGFKAEDLDEPARRELLDRMLQYPLFYDMYHRAAQADPELVSSPRFLDIMADKLRQFKERGSAWGTAALCASMTVQPEAEGAALFTVGWFFPNHISPTGDNLGHQYENWFAGSQEVVQFMLDNFPSLRERTLSLPEVIHTSSMPSDAADAVTTQLSTLTKCTWWTKAGNFGVWEGLGCCGFHTTDITYQGSFPIVALFPDLQKNQMEHGARFQRQDGRVHHFFTPDFSKVDEGFDRVDMNQQFVMLAARDYLWTGDMQYLESLWPHICRAMDNTALLDTDGDGLPDTGTRRNTYDVWDFTGCTSYIASLWLGALKAAIKLADAMGDARRAANWRATYEKGLASFDEKLWNGEYYVLWRDGDKTDECCMSDQMSGDWFSLASGWGPILGEERTREALQAIVRYNFRWSEGLINASYPPGKPRRLAASGNMQADAPWTGIEYTVAALLIDYGMVSEGMDIVRDIHDRYLRAGRFWNHVECGGHYYRAMSSWTLLIAFSGFAWDQPSRSLTLAPVVREQTCVYPFFTAGSWGRYYQENGINGKLVEITVVDGELDLLALYLPKLKGFEEAEAFLGGLQTDATVTPHGDGICVTFPEGITLEPSVPLILEA